jgi:short-subunit dehydrogenase
MANRGGDIVNVMSTAAKRYNPAETVYTAAKWGAKAYTRSLREAMKGNKPEIRIFEVYPCGMKTSFWEDAIRPGLNPENFPEPRPIAEDIINALTAETTTYQPELTFKRR